MLTLTPTGEVATFADVDQFQPGRTQFACGFFCCAIVKSMTPVGQKPSQTLQEMIAEAEQWYARYNGDNSIRNMDGMNLVQLYDLLTQIGLHFQATGTDRDLLRAWLHLGYPVIVAGEESSFRDLELGSAVPYPWHPSGNHIIVLTGVRHDNNFLVRDPANVTDLYNPHTLRPGPRAYDAAKMQLISATVVVPPWLPRPPANFDPRKEPFIPVIPDGWRDDGTTLTAPNGHKVVRGFREYVLSHNWHPENVPLQEEMGRTPLEDSNPALGSGTQQIFNWTVLEWTPARGIFIAWVGQELLRVRMDKEALAAKVAELEAKLNSSHQ
ncbi:MAG TPA: hypothetical protein VFA41_16425 [Ktedonobacteraceae bacterium]|jgi:hypothetical protein|nr:hypothetical protein [Ktedonobacteraceae bacterium]